MLGEFGTKLRRGAVPLVVAAGLVGLSACEGGILDVDDSGIIVPDDLDAAGPAGVPTIINGFVGDFNEAMDDLNRYASMLTDEMILAGTFPTRVEVDARRMLADNVSLTVEVYVPLHRARLAADTAVFLFEQRLGDPEFEEVQAQLTEGIVLGTFYGGYTRLLLAETYCWSILTGMAEESAPLMPDERVQQALTFLQNAEQLAEAAGMEDVRLASIVGQARANLWLRNFDQAAALASQIPRDFVYFAEFSNNDPSQYNELYSFTWGDTQVIRWTVGDGTRADRGNEIFPHLQAFVDLNLIRIRPPGFTSFNSPIPVNLQLLYNRPEADIFLASGVEALLIQAEVAIRNGDTQTAEDILNDLRSDFSTRATIQYGVEPPPAANLLQPLSLSGDMTADLETYAAERVRELWLTGDRHVTSRRFRVDGIDLFPPVKTGIGGGDDIAFPVPQRELDNNANISQACPSGAPGSWGHDF